MIGRNKKLGTGGQMKDGGVWTVSQFHERPMGGREVLRLREGEREKEQVSS